MKHKASAQKLSRKISGEKKAALFLPNLTEYLEYLLALAVITECNSLFTNSVSEGGDFSQPLFLMFAAGTAFVLVLLLFFSDSENRRNLPDLLLIPALLTGYSFLFFVLNVHRTADSYAQKMYLITFTVILPLFCLIFRMERRLGRTGALLLKHADLMTVFAALSLIIYLTITFFPENIFADDLRTRWIGIGNITHLSNYLNLCVLWGSDSRSILGFVIPRNYGFFPESPMFSLALNAALFAELFLRKDRRNIFCGILLSIAVFSTQSTLGMLLTLFAWVLKVLFCSTEKLDKKKIRLIFAVAVLGCSVVMMQKFNNTGTSRFSSLALHAEDYILAFKAFLKKPILGWGYDNVRAIQSLMSEQRYAVNRGLSNSVCVVLAQGGIVLGLFCMLPFLFPLLQIRTKELRQTAFWAVGAFSLYVLVIFHYHLLLILFMAFGYSFPDFFSRRNTARPAPEEPPVSSPGKDSYSLVHGLTLVPAGYQSLLTAAVSVLAILFFCLCSPFWKGLYLLFKSCRLFLGQSVWRFFFVIVILIFWKLFLSSSVRAFRESCSVKALLPALCAVVVSICFLAAENALESQIHTFLQLTGHSSDFTEALCLTSLYGIAMLPLTILIYIPAGGKHYPAAAAGSVCFSFVLLFAVFQVLGSTFQDTSVIPESEIRLLRELTDIAEGKICSDDYPALYKKLVPEMDWSASSGTGYAESVNTTVIVPSGNDLRELFNRGYEAAEISDQHLLYTNDPSVISALQKQTWPLYRYYPLPSYVSLRYEASRNQLSRSADGILWITGASGSMEYGPGWSTETGDYTVRYSLLFDNSKLPARTLVGRIRISCYGGSQPVLYRDVYSDEFTDGVFEANVSFSTGEWDDLEFSFLGEGEFRVGISSISVRQTPKYITVSDLNGRRQPIQEAYYLTDGSPYTTPRGYASRSLAYDRAGNIVSMFCYDDQGDPVLTKDGWAGVEYSYNSKRLRVREQYLGKDLKPMMLSAGYSSVRQSYNSDNLITDQSFFDTEGLPVITAEGFAGLHRDYDTAGRTLSEEYYDTSGALLLNAEGYARCEWQYNNAGDPVSVRFFGTDRLPSASAEGFSEIRRDYDELHRIVKESYYGTDGKLTSLPSGYAINERAYDDNGNITAQRYYGTDENPVTINTGYAELRRTYNELHLIVRESYFGPDGMPVSLSGGYAALENVYDEHGNVSATRYYGASGEPVSCIYGYAEIHLLYDDQKHIIRESYYDPAGKPVLRKEHYASVEREYSEEGKKIRQQYFGIEGEPVIIAMGYAEILQVLDEQARVTREEYFGTDGLPLTLAAGYAVIEKEYDEAGNVSVQRYYNTASLPVLIPPGYAEVRRSFNSLRQITSEAYFGTDGQPAAITTGCFGQSFEYDSHGNTVICRYLDVSGALMSCIYGYAEVHRSFNEQREILQESYYDASGQPVLRKEHYASVTREITDNGRNVTERYLGTDGTPIVTAMGYAILRKEYNDRRQLIRESYYGTDDRPVSMFRGYAASVYEYDPAGSLISTRYYDKDGKECAPIV